MGFFDRFRKKEDAKKLGQKKPRHIAEAKKKSKDKEDEAKKKQFQAVPSAGRAGDSKKDEPKGDQDDKKAASGKDQAKPAKAKSGRKPEELHESHQILLRPVITEKSGLLGAKRQYVFEIHPRANKPTVYKAIETVYGIKPTRINIINVRGKHVRYGRTTGSTKFWRKAIVTVPEGKSIDFYES